jgi:hypothetical protein
MPYIQRLGYGQFCLAGVDPHALHEWYLAVHADAFEWVEMPNTIGMSQFADGGLLASKPYAASDAISPDERLLWQLCPQRQGTSRAEGSPVQFHILALAYP